MGCRRMLGVWDRAVIMVGVGGLSQVCIARRVGRSPSVVCRQKSCHRGSGGVYQAEGMPGERRRWPGAAPRKGLLDAGMVLFAAACSPICRGGSRPARPSPVGSGGVRHSGSYGRFSPRPGPRSAERRSTRGPTPTQEDADRARHVPASGGGCNPQWAIAGHPIVGMRFID